MPKIKNRKGMMALCTAAAITPDYHIAFLSIAGAQTAVKAIWASVIARRSVLHVGNNYRAITGDAGVDYCLIKQAIAPGVHNWVLYPEPNPTAPYLLLIPLDGMTAQEQLVHVLNQHTLWPVKEEWGRVFAPEQIASALKNQPAKVVGIVHAETSTGAGQPLAFGRVLQVEIQ